MAAHRYWRTLALEPFAFAGLELTEFQLLAGTTRVDASATLTSNVAPTSGSLANLKDDDTSTGAYWNAVAAKGLVLSWDFGSGGDQDVTDVILAGADQQMRFIGWFGLQWSDDATTWTTYNWAGGVQVSGIGPIAWPGPRTKTVSVARGWNPGDSIYSVPPNNRTVAIGGTLTSGKGRGWAPQSSGVKQFEVVLSTATNSHVGIANLTSGITSYVGLTDGWAFVPDNGQKRSSAGFAAFTSLAAAGTVIGVVVDFTGGSITIYKNGVSAGVMFSGLSLSGDYFPAIYMNPNSVQSATLRTGGFTYPIAGATAWDAGLMPPTSVGGSHGSDTSVGAFPVSTQDTVTKAYMSTREARLSRSRRDYQLLQPYAQGTGRISGNVKDTALPANVPVYEKVRLYRERDGVLIREMWSNPVTGAYQFDNIDETEIYTVISYDHDKSFRAVIADNLTPDIIA